MKTSFSVLLLGGIYLSSVAPSLAVAAGPEIFYQPGDTSAFSGGNVTGVQTSRWWERFGDPALDALVLQLRQQSPDLAQARTRLAQARSLARSALTPLFPGVGLSASANTSPLAARTFGMPFPMGESEDDPETYTNASATLSGSLTIDPWGTALRDNHAGRLDAQATAADRAALEEQLIGQLVSTWLDVRAATAQLDVIEAQLASSQSLLALVQLRYEGGEVAAGQVFQQQSQLASTEAQLPGAQTQLAIARQRLAVLLGEVPRSDFGPPAAASLPVPGALPPVGRPSDLLDRRPDLQAAQSRLRSSTVRRHAAVGVLFPTFQLTAQGGWQGFLLEEWEEQWTWGVGASATLPLIPLPSVVEGLQQARLNEAQSARSLGQETLEAVRQVEEALVREEAEGRRSEAVGRQLEASRLAYEDARLQFAQGLQDFQPLLLAEISFQQAQLTDLQARRSQLAARIQLYTALGGSLEGSPSSETAP